MLEIQSQDNMGERERNNFIKILCGYFNGVLLKEATKCNINNEILIRFSVNREVVLISM